MRTFRITPTLPGQHAHHSWAVIAKEDDGSEVTVETYPTMQDAQGAMTALERAQEDDPA
jgi:hypothetical protein